MVKIQIGLNHQRPLDTLFAIFPCASGIRRKNRCAIGGLIQKRNLCAARLGGPDLMVVFNDCVWPWVTNYAVQHLRNGRTVQHLCRVSECKHQQVQRGCSLLPIDDFIRRNAPEGAVHRRQNQ